MDIGFIGLGKMGSPMALNLIRAGHTLTVYDLNRDTSDHHIELGASWAASPKDVAQGSELIFTSLPGPKEVESVALGKDGIIEGISPGTVYVDTSTNSPTVIRRIGKELSKQGVSTLDAPVSGGIPGAEAGTLAVMVGGDDEAFEFAKPVLEGFGARITHLGPLGSGAIGKLVHNAISMTTRIVVQEGLTLAAKAGVSPTVMVDVLRSSAFGKQLLLSHHIPDVILARDFANSRFSLNLSHKDVSLATELADEIGVPMRLVNMAKAEIEEAITRGWGDFDNMVTVRLQEERAGVEVKDE
jgi:3-hydroxyisobutyrate dehydrogenase